MAGMSGPGIINDGLVFCVDAKNRKCHTGSGTAVTDLVSATSGATQNNTSYNASGYFSLDGADDYISHNANAGELGFSGDQPFSICCWARVTNIVSSTAGKVLVGFGDSSVTGGKRAALFIEGTNDTMVLAWWAGDVSSNLTVSNNTWTHFACTYSGGGRSTSNSALYKNTVAGTLGGGTSNALDVNNMNWLHLGTDSVVTQEMAGDLGPIQIYNRALTKVEIGQNYNAHKSRFGL